ncbi:MAG TPA: threonine--tRNA ligase [Solirubrobacteraceae bacterium]|jgi:threonyl-tRNA synthetase
MTEHGPDAAVEDELYRIRHSLAHVLAMAVLELRPGAELGFGPPIDDGFYYDFILPEPLSEDDFPEIEKRMRKIIGRREGFEREEMSAADALALLDEMKLPHKREYAEEALIGEQQQDSLSFYRTDGFLDLCRGPHVEHTGKLPADAFRLRSLAGAYWRGDSDNVQMTRIYAWAFKTKKQLNEHVAAFEEALKRDHRKLGRELDIFEIEEETGAGLPLWLPNGTVLRDELEKLAKEFEFRRGYQYVSTPVIAKTDLYRRSGHLPYYAEHMFPFMHLQDADGEGGHGTDYVLRPMNCPHHHLVYATRPRSHRELPLRIAEYGNVYRYEDSGALAGLLRVRGMTMNDAHIYCTEDQIREEFIDVLRLHEELYEVLGIEDYHMRLSTWDPDSPKGKEKYVDDPEAWERTQVILREALEEIGADYDVGKGEAAFYGPKVDMQIRSVTGREETASTNQLDFAQPARFGLTYQGADNQPHRPYVIHRAPLGTHERFVAFLLERYAGAFPTWLAPVQVIVVTVSDRFRDYAARVVETLRNEDGVRAELGPAQEAMGKAIRNAIGRKIPNILVIGEREAENERVTLRRHGSREQQDMSVEELRAHLRRAIATRDKES